MKNYVLAITLLSSGPFETDFMEPTFLQSNCPDNIFKVPSSSKTLCFHEIPCFLVLNFPQSSSTCGSSFVVHVGTDTTSFSGLARHPSTKISLLCFHFLLLVLLHHALKLLQNSIRLCSCLLLSHSEIYFSSWLFDTGLHKFSFE